MKINGIKPAGDGGEISRNKTGKTSEKSFESFLKESTGEEPRKSLVNAPTAPSAIRIPPSKLTGRAVSAQAIKQVEAVLDDLDFYRNVMANSDVPLARLIPMATTLAEQKDQLVAMLPHVEESTVRGLIIQAAALIIDENSRLRSPLYS